MLKLARKNVAQATLTRKDMTKLDFADNSFDGLAAFYSIIHVPRKKHSYLFEACEREEKLQAFCSVSCFLAR